MALDTSTRLVRCSSCGQAHAIPAQLADQETSCPGCGKLLRADRQATSPPPGGSRDSFSNDSTADFKKLRPADSDSSASAASPTPASGSAPAPKSPGAIPSPLPFANAAGDGAAPAIADPLLETVLGKCQLQRRLGEGGMGAVYLARHLTLDVEVAVKVLPAVLAQRDRAFVDRFLREARTAARIHHPNIVQVLDVDFQRGSYFIVMEYVEGETAGARMHRKRMLSEREVVEIGMGVAAALEYARRKSIVHRDVKPDNILLSNEGEIKISDLGLAKRVSGEGGSDLTLRDQALGTPFYISPEQATNARAADHRSDLYSLGATLFHLATGQPPFAGNSAFHTMTMHLNEPTPELRAFRAELSLDLAALIKRLMHKNPMERFQTAGEVYQALRALYERLVPVAERSTVWTDTLILSRSSTGIPATPSSLAPAEPLRENRTPVTPASVTALHPPAAAGAHNPSSGLWPFALRSEISPAGTRPASTALGSNPASENISFRRPSRFWLAFLFLPFLNSLAFLWTGGVAKKNEWFYGGLGLLLLSLLLALCIEETPALVAFCLTYLAALIHGLSIRREFEFRVMDSERAAEEEVQSGKSERLDGGPPTSK